MKLQRRRQQLQDRTCRTAHTGPASRRHVTEHVHMSVNVNAENVSNVKCFYSFICLTLITIPVSWNEVWLANINYDSVKAIQTNICLLMIASNRIKVSKNNYSLAIVFSKNISKSISFVSIFDNLFNETSVILASPTRCHSWVIESLITVRVWVMWIMFFFFKVNNYSVVLNSHTSNKC